MDRRLALENVEAGAGDAVGFQRLDQRGFVDHRPARGVDQDGRLLHLVELRRADEVVRLVRERHVDRDEVRLGQQPGQVHTRRAQLLFDLGLQRLLVRVENPHVETTRPTRDPATDAPDADDAERRVVHVMAEHHVDLPAFEVPLAHESVALHDAPSGRHHPGLLAYW